MTPNKAPTATAGRAGMRPADSTILFVCTANQARSPLAAALLSRELSRCGRADIAVESAGTRVSTSAHFIPLVLAVAQDYDLDLSGHRSRQMSKDLALGADLVLTMTEAQRSALIRPWPAILARTFTLLEMHRLTESAQPLISKEPAELAALAHRARPLTRPSAAPEDIDDPIGQSARHLRRIARQIQETVSAMALLLAGADRTAAARDEA